MTLLIWLWLWYTHRTTMTRQYTRHQQSTNHDQPTKDRSCKNLTSALLYTGGNHNILGNWGREEELTIKRMEYT